MATDARERLRAAVTVWRGRTFSATGLGQNHDSAEAIVQAAEALLAELPPAGDAALLRNMAQFIVNGVEFGYIQQPASESTEEGTLAKARELLARAAKGAPAAAEPEPERDAWQPIETAPKDGTNVLLCEPYQDPTVGWFSQRGNGWCLFVMGCDENVDAHCKPTHWMPLPTAPAALGRSS